MEKGASCERSRNREREKYRERERKEGETNSVCGCLSASWGSGQGGLTVVAAQLDDGGGPESVCPAHVAEFVCIFAAFYARHALIFAVYSEAPGCVASQVKRSCTLHLIEEMCPRVHKTMLCRK
jgi:hypothetical protein